MEQRDAIVKSLESYVHEVLNLQGSPLSKKLYESYKRKGTFFLENAGFLETALHVYLREGLEDWRKAAYLLNIVKRADAQSGKPQDAHQQFTDFVAELNMRFGGPRPQPQYRRD